MSFVKKSFVEDRLFVQDIFDRGGRAYDFGPSPTIWSSKVWKSLKENYLDKNNLTFSKLIEVKSCEFHWYGEWLLKMRPIDIVPIEPLFKVFHYRAPPPPFPPGPPVSEVLLPQPPPPPAKKPLSP